MSGVGGMHWLLSRLCRNCNVDFAGCDWSYHRVLRRRMAEINIYAVYVHVLKHSA